MKYVYSIGLGIIGLFLSAALYSQDHMEPWVPNVSSFADETPLISNELLDLSSPEAESHPEFGILPYDAPCSDCMELIDKRTTDSRYYVDNADTKHFYQQKSFGNLHYQDGGRWISYDPRLKEVTPGIYKALHQETPTVINMYDHTSGFEVDGVLFAYNRHLTMVSIDGLGNETSFGEADWTNYTIGENGIHIINAWPGVDILIDVGMYKIESNFIITGPIAGLGDDGYLAFDDNLLLPDGYIVAEGEGEAGDGGWSGQMTVSDGNPDHYGFLFYRPLALDGSGIRENFPFLSYTYNEETETLRTLVPISWLSDPTRVYPVTIDPLVTSTATYAAGIMKFRFKGSFCGLTNPDCAYTLTVPRPANSTLTAATFSAAYVTSTGSCAGTCLMLDAGFQIDGPCGTSPSTTLWWSCNAIAIGTCSAVNYNLFSIVSCLAPACSGDVTFTMRNSYCFCNVNGTCPAGAAVPCQQMNNSTWSITISGHTLEVPANAVLENANCCVPHTITPAPTYGVPPYTYSWTTSATGAVVVGTGSTYTVTHCANTAVWPLTVTCVITDACGITQTIVYTMQITDCGVLPIELTSFKGFWDEAYVKLVWTTASEQSGDYFNVERAHEIAPTTFTTIAKVDAAGTPTTPAEYEEEDVTANAGTNYYRLKQVDVNGASTYSGTVPVEVPLLTEGTLYPNPTSGRILLRATNLSEGQKVTMSITNIVGEQVYTEEAIYAGGYLAFPTAGLPAGSYIATVVYGGIRVNYPFVRQ